MSEISSIASPLRSATWRRAAGVVAWVVVVVVAASVMDSYTTGLAATVGILALLGLSMVLVTGYAGQFSLAVGAFYGIGAYASTLLTVKLGWIDLLALAVGAIVAAIVGFLLARPLFRLRGHFLAMATLALTEVFYMLVNNADFTGGSSGLGGIVPMNLFGVSIASTQQQMVLDWLLVGAVLWGALALRRGREGRALLAIRGHEAAAAAAGINIASSKARIFTSSAVLGAVAGSLYAHQMMYINPEPFGLEGTIAVLMIAVLGGMQSPWGAVIGAIVLEVLNQVIEAVLPGLLGTGAVGAGEQMVIGLMLVLILVFRPDGVAGGITAFAKWLGRRTRPTADESASIRLESMDDSSPGDLTTTDMIALRHIADAEGRAAVGEVVLSASGLVKRYGGVTAVADVDIDIHAGEVLAVIGPNGAGKSTLVNMLSGNTPPTAGRIEMSGVDTTRAKAHQVARHGLSRTFQTPCLFDGMDVEATVKVGAHLLGKIGMLRSTLPTYGAVKEERELAGRAQDVLERLGLAHLARMDAKSLSLGQQKQIEIARALIAQPKVLLLDEPCAGLNKAEKAVLMQLLRSLGRENIGVLVIEHDMEFVMSSADRVQVLNFGATLAVGSPEQIQGDQAVIDAYLGVASTEDSASKEGASK